MGSRLFDYLLQSPLFSDELVQSEYMDLDDARLERELHQYRDFVDSVSDELAAEISDGGGGFRVLSGTGKIDAALLSQCAWYVNQFVVDDPLYDLTRPAPIEQGPMDHLLGLRSRSGVDRHELVRIARLLKALTPMVAANYLKLLPISRLFEPPAGIPMTFSPTGFADALPKPLMNWFHNKARLLEVVVQDGQMIARLPMNRAIAPQRGIGIEFGAPDEGHFYVYHLLKTQVLEMDEATRMVRFAHTLPEEPPTDREFRAWVLQSTNQAALATYRHVMREVMLALHFNARYLTRSPLVAELLGLEGGGREDIAVHTANTVLSLDVPFMEGADPAAVMKIRQEDGEAFQSFREALERSLRAVQLESDPAKARAMARHAVHELAGVQVAAINRQVRALRAKGVIEGAVALAGLVSSIAAGSALILATAGAVLAGAKTIAEYRTTVRENPAYFLWKVSREAR